MTGATRGISPLAIHRLWAGLYTGGILAVIVLIACLSFGSLIFGGELSYGVADGIGIALLSGAVMGLLVAFLSSYPASVSIPQDRTAPVLALMAAQVAVAMPVEASPSDRVVNILVAIALTSFLTGAVLFCLGRFRLGNLTRFIPYPVVGGFLSGSGWLLVLGSMRVMTGHTVSSTTWRNLFALETLKLWLPGVILGCVLFLAVRIGKKTKLLPVILLGSMVFFHVILWFSGVSVGDARNAGWLPTIPANENFFPHLWNPHAWEAVNFYAISHGAGLAATVVLTAVISILLNSSALELTVHHEIDLNQELRAAGVANLVGGVAGGMPGFQSLSLSRLAHDLGSRTRHAGIVAALLCGVAILIGPGTFACVPRFAPGGLLLYLGLGFLAEWLYDSWAKLPISDYIVVVLIVAVMGTFGYLEGVGFGVLAAVFLFIHNYSRVGVITHALTGADLQSNVDRPIAHQRLLSDEGSRLQVLKLQGFIFFGTANTLLNSIRARSEDRSLPPLQCVILDFRRVSGLDSSAALSLAKASQLARKAGFHVLLTQLPESLQILLQRGSQDSSELLKFFPDLDHALEWWESRILSNQRPNEHTAPLRLRDQLQQYWPNGVTLDEFLTRLQPREFRAGDYLIRQGAQADELYFIESGEVNTMLELGNGLPARRLRRQSSGTVLGELGLLLKLPRTASVVFNQGGRVFCLTADLLEQLKRERPDVAADFYQYLACSLSERVLNTTKSLRVLTD